MTLFTFTYRCSRGRLRTVSVSRRTRAAARAAAADYVARFVYRGALT